MSRGGQPMTPGAGDFRDRYSVGLEEEKLSMRRRLLTVLAGILDAAISANSGVPLGGPVPDETQLWRVTVHRDGRKAPICPYGWTTYKGALEEQRTVLEWLANAPDEQQFVYRLGGRPPSGITASQPGTASAWTLER
jgi:hypothetical protein